MKCKGIVALKQNYVDLVDVDVKDPSPDEVQIKMACTLISPGTERAWVSGLMNSTPSYPYVPGYCCSGWISKTGGNVKNFGIGDRVACYAVDVGHREIGNVPAYRVVKVPNNVSFQHAAFTSLGQTALQGVRKCKIELGEPAASIGLGIVGLLAMQFARLNGAYPVMGIDRVVNRLEIASRCNADIVIDNRDEAASLAKMPSLPSIVFDNTGIPSVMNYACKISADYGRVCILGCPRGTVDFNFYSLVQKKSLQIIGAHAVDSIPIESSYPNYWTFSDDALCFLNFVNQGRIELDPLISDQVNAIDALGAYRRVMTSRSSTLGVLINWVS